MNYKTIKYELNWDSYTSHRCIMLADSGEVIGEYSIQIPLYSDPYSDLYSYPVLVGFYIIPQFRGKGLSYHLLDDVFRLSYSLGLSELWLKVRKNNLPAIRLYMDKGFILDSDDEDSNYQWMLKKFI